MKEKRMSDFNMLTGVPYNVNVPEFQPERSAPVFPVVTRKYPCIENVVRQDYAKFDRLTWKIQQPDQSMVWQSVKLVLPLEMKAYRRDVSGQPNMPHADAELDMRVTSKRPACNIAVAESPMGAFRQSSLTINGKIFSEVNDFRQTLDACYRGTGPSSYGDNHSLKPVVCRDMHSPLVQDFPVQYIAPNGALTRYQALIGGRATNLFTQINHANNRTLDNAYSLLEHNGPFIERARKFQDELSFDGKTWKGLITNYLELGPFQARARVSNTAIPYVRDLHLRLNFDTNPSKFDSAVTSTMVGLPLASCRTVPGKLFEFGTIANLKHLNETQKRLAEFICGMKLRYTEKPYLEVQYVRYIEPMKSFYNLRCFEHQYEQSRPFQLSPPLASLVSPSSLQRVTSRLLSYPTKIYLYASLADSEAYPFALGGVRRSCMLKNIHCRINQRADIIFNPSQEECYEMFRRHTNSSLEYAAWLKAPIYCFDPVDLGQTDFLANDARLSLMEWNTDVSLTPLQIQEMADIKVTENLFAEGYDPLNSLIYETDLMTIGPALDNNQYQINWSHHNPDDLIPAQQQYNLVLTCDQAADNDKIPFVIADANTLLNKHFRFRPKVFSGVSYPCPTQEIIRIDTVANVFHKLRGFIWACINTTTDRLAA